MPFTVTVKDGKPRSKNQVERFFSAVVYYILMMLVVVAVLQTAGLSQAAAPIEDLVRTLSQALPNIAKALGILLIAFAAGYILRKIIVAGLGSLNIDRKFAELSTDDATKIDPEAKPFSQTVGNIVFYLLMLIGLASAFDALHIAPISEPLHTAIDKLVGALPSVAMAAVLLVIGWVLSRIVRVVLHNLLKGVGVDKIIDRIGLSSLFGKSTASAVIALVASAFIMFQAVLAALNELSLTTLSKPLTDMMTKFWLLLPSIAVSLVVVVFSVIVGRLLRSIVATALRNLGFDKLMAKIGFGKIAERDDRLGEPSELVGFFLQIAIVMLAFAQAFENLDLATWAAYVNLFLGYFLQNVLVAAVILGIGFGI
ncbi:MAG: mechanosensitive ion channel, partial [Nannocystaceae bacterium]